MAKFQVKKAKREKIYVKLALMAPSGGGKTYSALRLATGMAEEIEKETGKEAKILMVNTEAKRGYYYANEFSYDIIDLEAPYNPEKFVDVINFAVEEGYAILILDSTSHEWEGKGGCLELQQQAGGTYQAWSKVTPRHNRFITALADSEINIIATMRGKDQYEMAKDDRGKITVQKIGVGARQRDGFEYEFTCSFLLDPRSNCAEVEKDNSHLFEGQGPKLLTEDDGVNIIKWANSGDGYTPIDRNKTENAAIKSADELKEVKNEIVDYCKNAGGQSNKVLMQFIRDNGNPASIKDLDSAKAYLDKIKKEVK